MASKAWTGIYVWAMLLFGSLNTITLKVIFTMRGKNSHGEEEAFAKPWFACFLTFFAMSLALIFDALHRCRQRGQNAALKRPLMQAEQGSVKDLGSADSSTTSSARKVLLAVIPAAFDLLATGLCDMGIVLLPASVWQLLRGAELIFTTIFSVFIMRQRSYIYRWLAVGVVVLGIVFVGLAGAWGAALDDDDKESEEQDAGTSNVTMLLIGMCLALAGQVVQAGQAVAEEWLVKDIDLPAMTTVGLEGVWGVVLMLLMAFPVVYALPGSDHGHLEDDTGAIPLLTSSAPLAAMVSLFTFSCMTYNMAGIAVTEALSAVHRVMLEALRTGFIWVFGLAVHYLVDEDSRFGEVWTPYSWLEVLGFVCLMLGQVIYSKMLRIPGLTYPTEEEFDRYVSPNTMRSLAIPSPAS